MTINVYETVHYSHAINIDIPEEEFERLEPKINDYLDEVERSPLSYDLHSIAYDIYQITNANYEVVEEDSDYIEYEFDFD